MSFLLIADDSQAKIDMIVGMLFRFGWKGDVIVAMTTEQAEELMWEDVGFAFIDYYIPSKNGPALIRALKKKNPAIRVALVSSSDNYENRLEAQEAGAETCICTSYEADEVERAFKDVIEEWMA